MKLSAIRKHPRGPQNLAPPAHEILKATYVPTARLIASRKKNDIISRLGICTTNLNHEGFLGRMFVSRPWNDEIVEYWNVVFNGGVSLFEMFPPMPKSNFSNRPTSHFP